MFLYIYIPAPSNVVPFGVRPNKIGLDKKQTGKAKKNVRQVFVWSLGGLYNIKLAQSSLQTGAAFAFWVKKEVQ